MSSRELELNLVADNKRIRLIAEALSSDTRLEMINEIKKGTDSHAELAKDVDIKSSSITFHLLKLTQSGIIKEEEATGKLGRKKKVPELVLDKIVINL